jgi:Na+-transporting NADH:ubiquinone oxidoreductase subunit NqrB
MMSSQVLAGPIAIDHTGPVPGGVIDPRYGQIVAQCTLLALELFWLDFGPSPLQALVFIAGTQAMEAARARLLHDAINWKSALSTGLSLSLLLRTHEPLLWIAACVIGMGSKFVLRLNGKHMFNPSAFAIVALLLVSNRVWVSPGQWGTQLWLVALAVSMGCLILSRVARLDITLAFFATHAALLFVRAWNLGDPLAIPLHQLQSGSVLIFGLFMLTDPRSTRDSRAGRLLFAAAVALLAHELLFRWQVREGVFYALVLVSCATPILDRILPGPRFAWPRPHGV